MFIAVRLLHFPKTNWYDKAFLYAERDKKKISVTKGLDIYCYGSPTCYEKVNVYS